MLDRLAVDKRLTVRQAKDVKLAKQQMPVMMIGMIMP